MLMLVRFLDLSFLLPGQDPPATGSTAGGVQKEQGSAALSPYPAPAQPPPASGAPAPAPAPGPQHTPTPDSSSQSSSSAGPGPVSSTSAHPAPTGRLSPTQHAPGSEFIPQQPQGARPAPAPAPAPGIPAGSEGGGAMANRGGSGGTEQVSSMPAASSMPTGQQVPNLQQPVPPAPAAAAAAVPASQAQGCGESEGESQSKSPGIEDIHALDKKLRSLFMDQNSVSSSSTQPENVATESMPSPPSTVTSSPPLGTSNQMLPASQPVSSGQSDVVSAPTPADAGTALVSCRSASNLQQLAALFVWDVYKMKFSSYVLVLCKCFCPRWTAR